MKAKPLAALLALSLLWGSIYLAVRWGVAAIPPLTLAGSRHIIGGPLIWIVAILFHRSQGHPLPPLTGAEWKLAVIGGLGFIVCSDGGIALAEQYIPSSQAGLLVATIPIATTLGAWLCRLSERPRLPVWFGLALGVGGMTLLGQSSAGASDPGRHRLGVVLMIAVSVIWAMATLYFKAFEKRNPFSHPLRLSAVQMTVGGAILLTCGALCGEWHGFDLRHIPGLSGFSCLYLLVSDSLLGFPLYLWLVRSSPPALASSYAFLSPLVALFLGLTLGHDAFTPRLAVGATLILTAVALILLFCPPDTKVLAGPESAP